MNLKSYLSLGAASVSAIAGVLASSGIAEAALMSGDTVRLNGNIYTSLNQFDFVGPPPIGSPVPQSVNDDGFFTIGDATGGFVNGVFNTPQFPTPSGFVKDLRAVGTDGAIVQEGPTPDGSFGPVVEDFIVFDNTPNGLPLAFSFDLETLLREAAAGGPVTPDTEIAGIEFTLTGTLTDDITGEEFDAIGSITPNIGAGSPAAGLTFGELEASTDTEGNFVGPIGYQADFVIVSQNQPVPEPTATAGIALVLGLSAFGLKRKVQR